MDVILRRMMENMDKKRNNALWCCNRIEDLIKEYDRRVSDTDSEDVKSTYIKVIEELEQILYC